MERFYQKPALIIRLRAKTGKLILGEGVGGGGRGAAYPLTSVLLLVINQRFSTCHEHNLLWLSSSGSIQNFSIFAAVGHVAAVKRLTVKYQSVDYIF